MVHFNFFLSRSEDLMVPTLSKKGAASFVQSASTDPFTIEWYMKMTDNADVNKDLEARFTLKDPRFHETPTLIDFAVVFETFYKEHRVCMINYNNEIIYYTHDFFHSLHSRQLFQDDSKRAIYKFLIFNI